MRAGNVKTFSIELIYGAIKLKINVLCLLYICQVTGFHMTLKLDSFIEKENLLMEK